MRWSIRCLALSLGCLAWGVRPALSGDPAALWTRYTQAYASGETLPMPDYSYAGYALGERGIPEAAGPVFDVTAFDESSVAGVYSPGRPVEPASLYEAQLALRLGRLPAWVSEAREAWAATGQAP